MGAGAGSGQALAWPSSRCGPAGAGRFEPIDQETLRRELALNRQQMAQADSSIRGALRQRNDSVAKALADGVPVARIAAAADVNKFDVRRRIGAGYTELQPPGWPADAHLRDDPQQCTGSWPPPSGISPDWRYDAGPSP